MTGGAWDNATHEASRSFEGGMEVNEYGGLVLDVYATTINFDETGYLLANLDVADAVRQGAFESGLAHFTKYGQGERRMQRQSRYLSEWKATKLKQVECLLRSDISVKNDGIYFDCLTNELRAEFNITNTRNVASRNYDRDASSLVRKHKSGMILDCGAGKQKAYYRNVVSFEIVEYDTTDVRGVGEKLPFKDDSFDAVISLAVLEHVKDPFQCAREIIRVLKPGGDLMCCVPFLQPMHGYPNHYYNMTEQGIRGLFEPQIKITRHEVMRYSYPIWALTWIVKSWADGLGGSARDEFLNLKLSDLIGAVSQHIDRPYVTELSREKNFELACGTTIFGSKVV